MLNSAGIHILLELWDGKFFDDPIGIELIIRKAIKDSGCILLNLYTHKFSPQGVTCIAAIEESHISIHTWPEMNYAAVDIFTCGTRVDPYKAVDCIIKQFEPKHYQMMDIRRGTKL